MQNKINFISLLLAAAFFGSFNVGNVYADTFLDPTFGTGGKVTTSFGGEAVPNRVITQPDGKIVVAGYASNGSNNDWAIARYNSNGTLDNTFGVNGKVLLDRGNNDQLRAIELQSDGKLVVGGMRFINGGDFKWEVARFNSSGALDTAFGTNGITTTVFATDNNGNPYAGSLNDLIIQSDGKIVAVGSTYNGRDNVYPSSMTLQI